MQAYHSASCSAAEDLFIELFSETCAQKAAEAELYAKGEKPEALIDWPVDATDYELVDIFNWQEEAAGMNSQMEFVCRVDVQTETIERYVREGKLIPDLVVPMSERRTLIRSIPQLRDAL